MSINIRPRERDNVLQSLRAGVVPRSGQHLIQVGRAKEIEGLVRDIDSVADGGSSIRFVIGDYGSGKTFFLNLIRSIALEKKFVTMHADLAPDRRLHASAGQARGLYSELMRNLSTRLKPEGGAIQSVVERFITEALEEAKTRDVDPGIVISERTSNLNELVNGYDFSQVISAYWKGHDTGNEQLKSDAVRWLRGEFSTKTEARNALGVRVIIDDASVYDFLKLFARFAKLAGFKGLMICCDEMVNLYKLANTQARNSNYEQLLRILNDTLQGGSSGLAFLFSGTPEFLLDTRRGLYSYSALQSRLAENSFASTELRDYQAPVLRLQNLTAEDFYVLLLKIREVYAFGDSTKYLLPDDALQSFMEHCRGRIGESYFRTPRTTIVAFVNLLSVLEQNPHVSWKDLLADVNVAVDQEELGPDIDDENLEINSNSAEGGDTLSSFKL